MEEKTSVGVVYGILKKKILYCEYKPGELISEKDIVEELNTSRTPVREALNILNGQGLVSIIPKKGIQISSMSLKKMKEIYEIRRMLEPYSIKQAIMFTRPEDIEYLYDLDRKLGEELRNEHILEVFKIGMDVHLYIASLSRNETLLTMLKILRDESYRSLVYYLKTYLDGCSEEDKKDTLNLFSNSHIGFIQALEGKDEEKAVNYILQDLDSMSELILKIL
ncbi:GntR family transcriptional regulator [Petroclostridium sp. X23]|uniref:GntR family transcriptional regulator n=1 Tax=Petroclostridium sp. X23 TaxID=3045146 RepID=UPI0024AD1E5B|nr:GntR family transcriptional regulator [Petroclostridium sp. X23]WHH60453.1 GntR family transcriptional regulator [Petroclostridium sp. X23]